MNGPGMWQPRRNGARTWRVRFGATHSCTGEPMAATRYFATRAAARRWVQRMAAGALPAQAFWAGPPERGPFPED